MGKMKEPDFIQLLKMDRPCVLSSDPTNATIHEHYAVTFGPMSNPMPLCICHDKKSADIIVDAILASISMAGGLSQEVFNAGSN